MIAATTQSLILFCLMAIGWLAGKTGIISRESNTSLSRFLVNFTLPALILVSMQKPFSVELRNQSLQILAFSTLVYGLSFVLAFTVSRFYRKASGPELGVHRFAMCFSNVGFMGFPVAEAILGRESLFMVSIYNIPFQILAFSVGVLMIAGLPPSSAADAGNTSRRNINLRFIKASAIKLLNPAILAALVGFGLFSLSVKLPPIILPALDLLGSTTTPLAMVLIGVTLANNRSAAILRQRRLWLTTAYRLALHPALIFLLASVLGLQGLNLAVPVLIAAMPVAANTSILANVYGGDSEMAGGLVFVSTLASLLTIPLIVLLLAT